MNEQLQQALAEIANKASGGIDFLNSELPEVVTQLLTYKLVSTSVETIIMSLLIAGFIFFVKLVNASVKKEGFFYESYGPFDLSLSGFMALCLGGIAAIICFICIFANISIILKIWIAPKIYLIEYAASLAK